MDSTPHPKGLPTRDVVLMSWIQLARDVTFRMTASNDIDQRLDARVADIGLVEIGQNESDGRVGPLGVNLFEPMTPDQGIIWMDNLRIRLFHSICSTPPPGSLVIRFGDLEPTSIPSER